MLFAIIWSSVEKSLLYNYFICYTHTHRLTPCNSLVHSLNPLSNSKKKQKKKSDQAGLNRRPLNLQSNALPLSYSRSCFPLMCSDYQLPDTLYRFQVHLLSPPMIKYFKRTKNWIYGKFLKFVLWFMRNVWNSSFVLTILSFLYKRTNLQKVFLEAWVRL